MMLNGKGQLSCSCLQNGRRSTDRCLVHSTCQKCKPVNPYNEAPSVVIQTLRLLIGQLLPHLDQSAASVTSFSSFHACFVLQLTATCNVVFFYIANRVYVATVNVLFVKLELSLKVDYRLNGPELFENFSRQLF